MIRLAPLSLRLAMSMSIIGAALLIVLPPSPSPVHAQERNPKAEAKAEVDKAQLHYKLGRFDEALAAYARAYELFNAPALLFNIGQCHKNLKNYDRAIFFFEGYLREETNPEKRALAEELIAKAKVDLQRQQYEPPAPSPNLIPNKPPDATPANAAIDTDTVLPPADTGPTAPTPITGKWWFWTALGVAVIAVTGGTIGYYATGDTTTVPPSGSVGTLDRR